MSRSIIHTEHAPKAIGTYSQAVRVGNTVYVSGQIPLDPVSGQLLSGDIEAEIRRVFDNLAAIATAAGVTVETRDHRSLRGSLRASQLRNVSWPKSLSGSELIESKEVTWNDFVRIAQAVDPDRFSMTSDVQQAEAQQRAFVERLAVLHDQWEQTGKAIRTLMTASGTEPAAEAQRTMERIREFTALRENFDREAALKFAQQTWGDPPDAGAKADVQRLTALSALIGEQGRLASRLGWFRALSQQAPEGLATEIEMKRPLLSLTQITSGPGQLAVALKAADELHAQFMTRLRAEHKQHVEWQRRQREAIDKAAARLPTLERLNQIAQLGTPDLPGAGRDVERLQSNLAPCAGADDLDVGQGATCLSCGYALGDIDRAQPVGENAQRDVNEAIQRRARALSQGLIAETLEQAGNDSLNAILAAAQAGSFHKIIEEDLISDQIVRLVNDVLKRSKQQTVASGRVYEFLEQRPALTQTNLDPWLAELRKLILQELESAKKSNPGKEVTLLLKAGDDS